MLRKRLVVVCFLAAAVSGVVVTHDAVAQEIIDLDEEAAKPKPKPKPKGGGGGAKPKAKPAGGGAAKGGAAKGGDAKGGDAKGGDAKGGSAVDIDLDEDAPAEQGPVVAGQMTEEAAAAKKLFDRERWSEAAQALYRVVNGETGDDAGNKQLAQYYLAISLYRLKFYQASYAIFSVVADNKHHLK
ncbi:MAG TPA: hypothetical protein PKD61_04815, partial [Polyangiaceae bacterium]|nr:hypothetical protein [Polyangiaceae bacterium]